FNKGHNSALGPQVTPLCIAAVVGVIGAALSTGATSSFYSSFWVTGPLALIAITNALYVNWELQLDFPSLGGIRLDRPILLCILPIWVGDTLAIFVGKAIGKHKLWPAVSPNKTWEGGIANLIGCVAAGGLLAKVFHVSLNCGLLIGVSCGIFGQVGD